MTLNMQCVCKSLRKDYTEVAWIPALIVSGIVGWYIGMAYAKQICDFIYSITSILYNISSSTIYAIVLLCTLLWFLIDAAMTEKSKAKSESCLNNIGVSELALLIISLGLIVLQVIYSLATNIPLDERRAYFCEIILILLIITIINAVTMPMAFAYARCKDEPLEPEVQKNESNDST